MIERQGDGRVPLGEEGARLGPRAAHQLAPEQLGEERVLLGSTGQPSPQPRARHALIVEPFVKEHVVWRLLILVAAGAQDHPISPPELPEVPGRVRRLPERGEELRLHLGITLQQARAHIGERGALLHLLVEVLHPRGQRPREARRQGGHDPIERQARQLPSAAWRGLALPGLADEDVNGARQHEPHHDDHEWPQLHPNAPGRRSGLDAREERQPAREPYSGG